MLIARLLIGLVILWNLQAALFFLLRSAQGAASFELSGALGEAVIRSLGLLFVMWNVPYAVALWQPVRYRVSLYEATAMQAIGLAGETWIYLALPASHTIARASLERFLIFDSAGLLLLLLALWLTRGTHE